MDQQRTAAASSSDGPAARTRAAAWQQQAAELLPLLLHHNSIRTQLPLVCKLLCCSKALAAAVAEHSAGQLDMPSLSTDKAQQAAPWLLQHARLVRSLDLQVFRDDPPASQGVRCAKCCIDDDFIASLAVPALMSSLVAARLQSLALQSLKVEATTTTLPLLEQLPASRLTHLELSVNDSSVEPHEWFAFMARVSAALARLTALRSLDLYRSAGIDATAPPMSGLSALTQLTALAFCGPLADLQHAPPQLLELTLDRCFDEDYKQPLDLRHLAAVTALTILNTDVRAGDVLPPNLLRLQININRNPQHFAELLLEFEEGSTEPPDITADQLRALSRLTALSLRYCGRHAEPASAGAWPVLPLQQLSLQCCILAAPVCQQLAQLSGLTRLVLRGQLPQAGSAQQLAAALRQLSGLQQLKLHSGHAPEGTITTQEEQQQRAAGGQQLLQAIGCLQQLRELHFCCFQPLAEPAVAGANSSSLTALTALMALSLEGCDLTDAAVTAIVSQLPGLQSLDCSRNLQLTDAVLLAIGRLQQLVTLRLDGTRVADASLQQLGGLTQLKELFVRETRVTDAGVAQLTGLLQELRVQVAVQWGQGLPEHLMW